MTSRKFILLVAGSSSEGEKCWGSEIESMVTGGPITSRQRLRSHLLRKESRTLLKCDWETLIWEVSLCPEDKTVPKIGFSEFEIHKNRPGQILKPTSVWSSRLLLNQIQTAPRWLTWEETFLSVQLCGPWFRKAGPDLLWRQSNFQEMKNRVIYQVRNNIPVWQYEWRMRWIR